MANGGQPQLGSNPFIGIDATGLQVLDAEGADNFVMPATGPVATVAGQLVYGDPNTTANVSGLPAGLYELSAAVTFGGSPPMAAFIDFPVIEVF